MNHFSSLFIIGMPKGQGLNYLNPLPSPTVVTPLAHSQSHGYHIDDTKTDKETDNKYLNKLNFPLFCINYSTRPYYYFLPHDKFWGMILYAKWLARGFANSRTGLFSCVAYIMVF